MSTFPRSYDVKILLDDAPHYKGSIHDDEVARARGYKAALIPGAFIYGHISRGAIDSWGVDWAERGSMSARFRKPVYNHETITVFLDDVTDDGTEIRSQARVLNQDGDEVATGWIALSHTSPTPPDVSTLKFFPSPNPPPPVKAGEILAGAHIHSRERLLTDEDYATSRSAFAETHPIYDEQGFVHSGMLMRLGMGDVNTTWKFPAAVVLVENETQHFCAVYPGQTLRLAGTVAETYERKGKHYLVTDEVMLADGVPAARYKRTQIYG